MNVPAEREIVDLIRKGHLDKAEQRIALLVQAMESAAIESTRLRERLHQLERELATRNALSFDGQFYWTGAGDDRTGPFCPNCFDVERVLLRLQSRTVEEIDYDTGYTRPGAQIYYRCTRCSRKTIQAAAPS